VCHNVVEYRHEKWAHGLHGSILVTFAIWLVRLHREKIGSFWHQCYMQGWCIGPYVFHEMKIDPFGQKGQWHTVVLLGFVFSHCLPHPSNPLASQTAACNTHHTDLLPTPLPPELFCISIGQMQGTLEKKLCEWGFIWIWYQPYLKQWTPTPLCGANWAKAMHHAVCSLYATSWSWFKIFT